MAGYSDGEVRMWHCEDVHLEALRACAADLAALDASLLSSSRLHNGVGAGGFPAATANMYMSSGKMVTSGGSTPYAEGAGSPPCPVSVHTHGDVYHGGAMGHLAGDGRGVNGGIGHTFTHGSAGSGTPLNGYPAFPPSMVASQGLLSQARPPFPSSAAHSISSALTPSIRPSGFPGVSASHQPQSMMLQQQQQYQQVGQIGQQQQQQQIGGPLQQRFGSEEVTSATRNSPSPPAAPPHLQAYYSMPVSPTVLAYHRLTEDDGEGSGTIDEEGECRDGEDRDSEFQIAPLGGGSRQLGGSSGNNGGVSLAVAGCSLLSALLQPGGGGSSSRLCQDSFQGGSLPRLSGESYHSVQYMEQFHKQFQQQQQLGAASRNASSATLFPDSQQQQLGSASRNASSATLYTDAQQQQQQPASSPCNVSDAQVDILVTPPTISDSIDALDGDYVNSNADNLATANAVRTSPGSMARLRLHTLPATPALTGKAKPLHQHVWQQPGGGTASSQHQQQQLRPGVTVPMNLSGRRSPLPIAVAKDGLGLGLGMHAMGRVNGGHEGQNGGGVGKCTVPFGSYSEPPHLEEVMSRLLAGSMGRPTLLQGGVMPTDAQMEQCLREFVRFKTVGGAGGRDS